MRIKKIPLWGKVLIGLALGALVGLILKDKALYLKPIGTIFINGIKMLIVPLVFSSFIPLSRTAQKRRSKKKEMIEENKAIKH